jgi:hypothetical protein
MRASSSSCAELTQQIAELTQRNAKLPDDDVPDDISLSPGFSNPGSFALSDDLKQSLPPEQEPKFPDSPECSLSLSSPPTSPASDGGSDVGAFLSAFNSKYDVCATNLFDILDLIDSRILNLRHKHKALALTDVSSKLQIEKENMSLELAALKSQVSNLEHKLANARKENDGANETAAALQNENEGLRQALDSINGLMEVQISDLSALGEQRAELLKLTQRQDLALEELEKFPRQSKITPRKKIEAKPANADFSEELQSLAASIVSLAADDQAIARDLRSIRDEETSTQTSVLEMFQYLLNKLNQIRTETCEAKHDVNRSTQKYQRKCCELVSLLEEELNFLQKLTDSSGLQSVLFTSQMGDDRKAELIRHCAAIGRFIEDAIGMVSQDKFEDMFTGVRPTHVFELLQSTTLREKLADLLSRFEDQQSLEVRELFDLLSAQVFVNDLLVGHTSELHCRIAQYNRDVTALRQETEDSGARCEEIDDLRRTVKLYRRQDHKLRRFLRCYVEAAEDTPTLAVVKDLVQLIQDQASRGASEDVAEMVEEKEQ